MKNVLIIILGCLVLVLTTVLIFLGSLTGTMLNAVFKAMYGTDLSKIVTFSWNTSHRNEEFEKLQKIVEGKQLDDDSL